MTESMCLICRRPIKDHSIAEARRCLAAIESIESQKFCRLGKSK